MIIRSMYDNTMGEQKRPSCLSSLEARGTRYDENAGRATIILDIGSQVESQVEKYVHYTGSEDMTSKTKRSHDQILRVRQTNQWKKIEEKQSMGRM